jgi:hypothetical protein
MQALDLIFRAGGLILAAIVVVWLVRTRAIDRSRGRRRCPRCWYGMEGVPSLTCPECGRAARDERRLFRTRWRKRRLALGAMGLLVSAGVFLQPEYRAFNWAGAPRWLVSASILWKSEWPPRAVEYDDFIWRVYTETDAGREHGYLASIAALRLWTTESATTQQRLARMMIDLGHELGPRGAMERVLSFAERPSADPNARRIALQSMTNWFPQPDGAESRIAALLNDQAVNVEALHALLAMRRQNDASSTLLFQHAKGYLLAPSRMRLDNGLLGYDGWNTEQQSELLTLLAPTNPQPGALMAFLLRHGRTSEVSPAALIMYWQLAGPATYEDPLRDALTLLPGADLDPYMYPLLLHACSMNPRFAEWFVPLAARHGADPAICAWYTQRLLERGRTTPSVVEIAWQLRHLIPDVEDRILAVYRSDDPWRSRMGPWRLMILSGRQDEDLLQRIRADLSLDLAPRLVGRPAIAAKDASNRQRFIRLSAQAMLHSLTGEASFPAGELRSFLRDLNHAPWNAIELALSLARALGPEHVGPMIPVLIDEVPRTSSSYRPDILIVLADLAPSDPRVRAELAWASENLDTRSRVLARALLRRIESAPPADRPSPALTP